MLRAERLDSAKFGWRFSSAFQNALNRPSRVLCDQWLWIGCCAFECGKVQYIAHIAQSDTHITQKAGTLDSFDWRLFEECAELSVIQFQVFPQRNAGCRLARGESCFVGNPSEAVPWTDIQTIIATEDSISYKRAKLHRNGTF